MPTDIDKLDEVCEALLAGVATSAPPSPPGWPRIRFIAFGTPPSDLKRRLTELQRLASDRFGLTLKVVGGALGCFGIEIVPIPNGYEVKATGAKGEQVTIRLVQTMMADGPFLNAVSKTFSVRIVESANGYSRENLAISSVKHGQGLDAVPSGQFDCAILCALQVPEYRALRSEITSLQPPASLIGTDGQPDTFEVWNVPYEGGTRRIVTACLSDMGNVNAAQLTERAIANFDPGALMFVGIAGALGDGLELGDVVYSRQIVHYDTRRKLKAGSTAFAPKGYPADRSLLNCANRIVADATAYSAWQSRHSIGARSKKRVPKAIAGDIASGDAVVDATQARSAIKALNRKLDAVEMEGAGLMEAAFNQPHARRAIVIRGISDFAMGKTARNDRPRAAATAASFAMLMLQRADFPTRS